MNKSFAFLMLLWCSTLVFGQKTISGKITDSDGQAVPSASITIEEAGKDAILAYTISNSKGEYKLTFTSDASQMDVKVKAFNLKGMTKQVKNETQILNFNLQSEATEIKEVKIKTKLITKKGDTIAYDLSRFENKADRSLADVLKKIPGIEVGKNGQILYQGEAINKFYVNGKDLMEGGYGTIVNSLPKDAVQKMEVMENHQPVKALQNKMPSESAAINIKLKNKITMTGRGEVGAGFSPMLWNVKLTPMFFGQNNQWVVNYKANNVGESVENEGNVLAFGSRWEGRRIQASQRNWLSVDQASVPNVPERRYLFNNVHFFSANLLTNPFKDKEWELKVNSNYSNNAIYRESRVETVYEPSQFFPNGARASTDIANHFYNNSAKGEVIFTKNAKKGFFKNVTTWNSFWNDNLATVRIQDLHRGSVGLDEKMRSPSMMFQNSLSTIIPVKEKMVNFMSYVGYQKDNQRLNSIYNNFTDFESLFGRNFTRLDQDITLTTLNNNHSASVGFSYKKWTLTPEMGLNLSFNEMNSNLYGDRLLLNSNFQNQMKWNELKPYTQLGLNYKGNGLNININLPMNFYGMNYKNMLNDNDNRHINRAVFEPSFFANYEIKSFWKLWAFGNLNYDFGNFGSLYTGNVLTSPRIIGNNNSLLPENRKLILAPRLEYRNPLNNLFFNIRYGYNNLRRNLINETTIFSTGANISRLINMENTTTSQSQSAEVGKYFPKFKTNLSTSFSNRDANAFGLLRNENTNTSDLIETKIHSNTLGLKFNNTYFSWMSIDYTLSMSWNQNRNLYNNSTVKTSGWNHNLTTFFYPNENHTIGFFWDDVTSAQMGNAFRNSFFDASYQFTWTKKKIDFELKWMNIGNKKMYETISYNAIQLATTRSAMMIRPSQVMLTVKFNFK